MSPQAVGIGVTPQVAGREETPRVEGTGATPQMVIFTILILPIHEHGIFLHLLVSSLISFTSVL